MGDLLESAQVSKLTEMTSKENLVVLNLPQ